MGDKTKEQEPLTWARAVLNPVLTATVSIDGIFPRDKMNLGILKKGLEEQTERALSGKTEDIESMLFNQAQTLQAAFCYLMGRIGDAQMISQLQAYVELGIKANNACRKTLLALHQIKNPMSPTFIQQQNNAHNQQVNNASHIEDSKKNKKPENELLSEGTHEEVDFRRTTASVKIDS